MPPFITQLSPRPATLCWGQWLLQVGWGPFCSQGMVSGAQPLELYVHLSGRGAVPGTGSNQRPGDRPSLPC